jgi:hypothetical protein
MRGAVARAPNNFNGLQHRPVKYTFLAVREELAQDGTSIEVTVTRCR